MNETDIFKKLFDEALRARKNANAVYSGFKVGAAILTKDDNIYTGCNIESSSYGLSVCAERVALFNALNSGEKRNNFKYILITAESNNVCSPCGACRQLLMDYAEDISVVMTNTEGKQSIVSISELLKYPFKL